MVFFLLNNFWKTVILTVGSCSLKPTIIITVFVLVFFNVVIFGGVFRN